MSKSKFENTNTNNLNTTNKGDVIYREDLIRVKKKKKFYKRHPKTVITLFSIAGLILLSILLVLIMWLIGMNNMKSSNPPDPGKVVYYNGHKYVYNENIIDVLLIGTDQRDADVVKGVPGQADFIMLMALDTENNKLTGISVPRDMMVEVGQYLGDAFGGISEPMQIALGYAYGDGKEKSCEYTKQAVSRLLYNMTINKYISLNTRGVGPLTDAIGGVTLTAKESIPNTNIVAGQNTILTGNNAVAYVQYRTDDINGSENRRARDVQFVEEYYNQSLKKITSNFKMATDTFNIAQEYGVSNFIAPDFVYLSTVAVNSHITSLNTTSLTGEKKMGEKYVEIWPDQTQVFETVLSVFYNQVE